MSRYFLAIVVLGTVSPAGATVIDFNSLTPSTIGVSFLNVGATHSQNGFNLAASGVNGDVFQAIGSLRSDYTGTAALLVQPSADSTTTITLTAISGNPFAVESIDLAKWFQTATKRISFVGNLDGGGTVTQSFDIPPAANYLLSTYTFPVTFTNLASLQWTMITSSTNTITTNNYHQFDNIVVQELFPQTIPEPSTLALIVAGVVVLLAAKARRSTGALSP